MSFWNESKYNYKSISNEKGIVLIILVSSLNRKDLIEWLEWNDSNGIYNDEASLREFGKVMSRDEGVEIMLRQIIEGQGE